MRALRTARLRVMLREILRRVSPILGMLAVALLACCATNAVAQSDTIIHVKSFRGPTVGQMVGNAQVTCPPSPLYCILVIDGSLEAAPPGTIPTLGPRTVLWDFRTGVPNSGGGGTPSAPDYSVQIANLGSTAFTSDPNFTINPITHIFEVGGLVTGPHLNFTNLSTIPTTWTFDITTPTTALDSLFGLQPANTLWMNASGSAVAATAVTMPTCTAGADLYNTTTHAWSCVTSGFTGQDEYGTLTGCAFANDGGGLTCSAGTITWGSAFADTSYNVGCWPMYSAAIAGGSSTQPVIDLSAAINSTTQITVTEGVAQGSSGGYLVSTSYGLTIYCQAHHS